MIVRNSRSRLFILGIVALLCTLVASAAWAAGNNGPVVGPNVQINDPQKLFPADLPSRNTVTLAASADGQELLAGWDDFQGFCGPPTNRACPPPTPAGVTGYGFSTDGGTTWTDGGAPEPIGTAQTAGHPWLDRGTDNKHQEAFFLSTRMRADASWSAGIGVFRGHFNAGTFTWDDAKLLAPSNPNDFYSRQALAAARDKTRAAYIIQSNIIELCNIRGYGFGQIEVFRTHDGGNSWQGPVVVSPDATEVTDPADPECGLPGFQQVAPAIAVGPDGEVYAIWQFGPHDNGHGTFATRSSYAFARSFDGGKTFSKPKLIVTYNNNRDDSPVGYGKNRFNDQPRITVAQTGKFRGRIYVTLYSPLAEVQAPATQQELVSIQSYLLYSDNRGRTWTAPKPIAPPLPATGVKRFWPTPAVRPNGDLDIVFLESQEKQITADPTDIECSVLIGGGQKREGTASSIVDTYWVESHDGGATFSAPLKISSESSNWCAVAYQGVGGLYSSFGDYIGVDTANKRTFAAWPDGRNGVTDVFFTKVKGTAGPGNKSADE
jgi:hypothetical protein